MPTTRGVHRPDIAPSTPGADFAFSDLITCIDDTAESRIALDSVRVLARRAPVGLELVIVNSPRTSELRDHDELASVLAAYGLHATPIVLHDNDVASAVARHLEHHRAPMLCMTSHGRTALGALVLGSTSESIVHLSRHPALMIGPHARALTSLSHRLLVCLDGSDVSEDILPVALAWVATFGGDVLVVRHLVENGDETDADWTAADSQLVHAARWLRERGVDATSEIIEGRSAQDAICDTARRFGISAVAMTTRARTGLRRLGYGSVALDVLRDAPRAVLLVNPSAGS